MKFTSTLIAVSDLEKSKKFYQDVLGLDIIADFGANVTLTGGVVLQTLETWKQFINKDEDQILFKNNSMELYFEEDDMDKFIEKLNEFKDIVLVHELTQHSWGQRAVRFYDPDMHIIEVGENISMVVKRFIQSGLSIEETAVRMDVSVEFINSCLE